MGDSEIDEEYEPEELSIEEKIRKLMTWDDKELFVSEIKQLLSSENRDVCLERLSPSFLLKSAGHFDAVECGTALVQGETGLPVDVNVPDEFGAFPLHHAADGWSLGLIKLYLEHGARFDVRCASHHFVYGGELPFISALPSFRHHVYLNNWTPNQSIFKLIITLCLPELRNALEVVKFLAWNTKGAEEEIYLYAKKGEILHLAVLLLVAHEKFNAPFPFPTHDGSKLFEGLTISQVIATEIKILMNEDVRTTARGEGNGFTRNSKDKKKLKNSALLLLEVFERAGDAINSYLQLERTNVPMQQVANEVASLLQEAGFNLKHQDIDLSDLNWPSSSKKLRDIVKRKYLNTPLSKQPCSIQPSRNEDKLQNMTTMAHEASIPKGNFMRNEQKSLASLQLTHGSSTLPSNVQSYHTLHSGDDGLSSKLPLTSETPVLNFDEVLDMEEEIKDLIVADNKHDFVSIIKSQSKLSPSKFLMWVCCHRAVNCATAILDGETDLRVNLNSAFKCGSFPLHHAAHSLSSGLIELFLQHGADANLKCDDAVSNFGRLLPLNVALKTLRCHKFLTDWTPKKSIYKLLFILCRPEMKEPLDAIKLLALKTKEVEDITFNHAKEGDLVELAALLMVAREKVMSRDNDGSSLNGSMRIRQCIIHKTTSLDEEFRSIDRSQFCKLVRMYKDKKALMSSVLLLLEVFEKAGPAIEEYVQNHSMHVPTEWVPKEVAWMLEFVGFDLKQKDIVVNNIKCFSPKLAPELSEELKECRSLIKKFRMPLRSKHGGVSRAKSVIGIPSQQRRSICFSHGYPVSYPVSRSYHTFEIPKPSFGSRFVATLETEVKRTNKTSQPCVSNLPTKRQWASFAFAITRGLRRI